MCSQQNDKCKLVHCCFYFDYNKISHKDPAVVTEVIDEINEHLSDLVVTRGIKYYFLGMDITIENRKVKASMKSQLEEAIQCYSETVIQNPATPAAKKYS